PLHHRHELVRALCRSGRLRRPKHDLELFLASRAPHGRRIGWVRRDVEMLARHEARADVLAAERARDLVRVEGPAIDRASASLVDLLHAASLGAWPFDP